MVARKPTVSISAQAPKKPPAKKFMPKDAVQALVQLPKYRDLFRSCAFDPRSKKHAQLVLELYRRTQPSRQGNGCEPILLNNEYWKLHLKRSGLLELQRSPKGSVKPFKKSPAAKPKKRPAPVEQVDNSVIVIEEDDRSAAAAPPRVDSPSDSDDWDTNSASADGPPAPEGADGGADHDDQASSDSDDGRPASEPPSRQAAAHANATANDAAIAAALAEKPALNDDEDEDDEFFDCSDSEDSQDPSQQSHPTMTRPAPAPATDRVKTSEARRRRLRRRDVSPVMCLSSMA